jgi:hypothetical protein
MTSGRPGVEEEGDAILRVPEAGESLLTPAEAAVLLRVSEEALAHWASFGVGPPFYGWAKTPFYRRSEVLGWMKGELTAEPDPLVNR